MSIFVKTLLCFVLFPQLALAFFPEYQHFSGTEGKELNAPYLVGSEYYSDQLTFEFPIFWNYDWLKEEQIFQYGAGSLGPTRFLTRGRLRVHKDITDNVYFQLSWLDMADYEKARRALVFEFGYKLFKNLSLSLYGQSATFKSEDDIGVSANFQINQSHRLRLFHTWVDFSLNKRNEESDFYEKKPTTTGFVWRWLEEEQQSFSELAVWADSHQRRIFSDSSDVYQYQRWWLSLTQKLALDDKGADLLLRGQFSNGFEMDTREIRASVDRWDSSHVDLLTQISLPHSWVELFGLKLVHREWRSQQGHVIHNTLLPHLWVPFYRSYEGKLKHEWRAGFETTWHRGQGKKVLRSLGDYDNKLEHRLNLRYSLESSHGTRFYVLLTFDGDQIDSPWEGGSIQYSMPF